ncbi:MAG: DEAD/DEAH box helicase [Mesorhizobium sp.]|uniref:DEAD/DEAH box helicase n=1 Tax=Mesorhizobium sp. TaxID=1871066 RepID=UPI000FE6A8B2|nr:DEAD/DEAH box helicase [Mesorhizobium sp.]RWL80278.1 MAG: DEAD/DEAH box helicase [Mesorhizobium sp.]RWL85901.1 MAG: DEAD/DEAH box helicase [Mesorhizobium sp.]RWL93148.1 MAG: DEAD/DEAH box helicase [Mesorhizobium sp.]
MSSFEMIVPALAEALEKRGYSALTPVQKAVLEPELGEADALVSAQTGSGKTVAFGLAVAPTLLGDAQRFTAAGAPLGLVVAPTRELALQVRRELEWLYELTGAQIASCVGGMDMRTERRALERGAHIVVGTPGRLRDHITRGALDMSALKAVVLDEADEMLDLGFREDLEFILDAAPAVRRTLMFSATVPRSIATLAKSYQRDAVRISAGGEERQHLDIEYRALSVAPADRENAIINVLRYYEAANAMVFCNTRAAVNHLTARFNNRNFAVVALSGELSQNERSHALQAMRDGRAKVCIATDVAARGIDLPNLDLVIHADLPSNPETLLHRSGRTGRAGRKGVSALIVPGSARRRTERLLANAGLTATWASPPSADEVLRRDDERILADPSFGELVKDEERDFAAALLERHGAELVAAAFVRLCRGSRSAPEDLIDVGPFAPSKEKFARREEAPARRDDFGDSVWFSLSVGRRQNAEPRWLIPMLCRTAGMSKREIGAIKMQPEETFVQIAAGWADRFVAAISPDCKLQGSIAVRRIDGTPDLSRAGHQPPKPDKKPHRGKQPFGQGAAGFEKRAPVERQPGGEVKSWAKKPGKPKFDKPGQMKNKKSKKPPV